LGSASGNDEGCPLRRIAEPLYTKLSKVAARLAGDPNPDVRDAADWARAGAPGDLLVWLGGENRRGHSAPRDLVAPDRLGGEILRRPRPECQQKQWLGFSRSDYAPY